MLITFKVKILFCRIKKVAIKKPFLKLFLRVLYQQIISLYEMEDD